MADTTALKNRIRAAIKANDNQEITGPVLQQALLDMVDELNGATETEASQRQNGDSTLQQGINTERQQRQDADTALGQRITEEIQQEAERAEEAFDDLDMIDAAGSQVSPEAIDLTLRKNDGSEVDPEWQTLCHLLIPSATNQRAGLMSAAMFNLLYNLQNAGYAFAGIAVTDTNPGIPFANCFYIAKGAGTYTYFKNADDESIIFENGGIYVLTYDSVENHYWEYNLIVGIDDEPTVESDSLIKSGSVFSHKEIFNFKVFNKLSIYNSGIPYYGSDGTVYNNQNRDRTILLPVLEGEKYLATLGNSASVLSIAAFDSSKNLVIASSVADTISNYEYTVPSGIKYLQFCNYPAIHSTFDVKYIGNRLSALDEKTESLDEKTTLLEKLVGIIDSSFFNIVGFCDNTGAFNSGVTSFRRTDFIELIDNPMEILAHVSMSGGGAAIAFFSDKTNASFISSIPGIGNSGEGIYDFDTFEIPSNAKYVVFSTHQNYLSQSYVKLNIIEKLESLQKSCNELKEDVSDLKEDVSDLKEMVNDVEISISDSDLSITTSVSNPFWVDGTMYTYNTRKCTDYIAVEKGDVISYYLAGSSTTRVMAFNSGKNALLAKASTSIEDTNTYTVPEGVSYVRLYALGADYGGVNNNWAKIAAKGSLNLAVEQLEDEVGKLVELGDTDISISCGESNPFWVDGTMYIFDTRCSSDFISVKEGEVIKYILYGNNTTRVMAFDSSKNPLIEKASTSIEDIGTYVVLSGVSFVKLYRLKESSGGQTGNKADFIIEGILTDVATLKEKSSKYPLTILGFSDFVKLGSGVWTISNDGVSATSSSTGLANAIKYPINAVECEDSFIMNCRIMGTTDSFEGLIGKLDGTVAGILKDSNGSYATLYGISNGTLTQKHKVPLSFEIKKNEIYSVSLEKKTTTINYFILSISDKHGNIDTFEFGNGSTIEGDTYNDNSYNSVGVYGWGNPCCVVNSGTIEFSYCSILFGSLVEQQLLIWGHSFIEGQSIPAQKDKRFSALMKTEVGDDRCIIWGKSGATTPLLKNWFDSVKKIISGFKYIVFCIGTNDGYMNPTNPAESYYSVADQNTAAVNCQYLYDECLKLDIVPIFMLQTPLKTTGNIPSVLNAYMIAHFKYVIDPRGVFYNSDGTINQAIYNDDVHPNVLGHQKIFNLIKTQAANVF